MVYRIDSGTVILSLSGSSSTYVYSRGEKPFFFFFFLDGSSFLFLIVECRFSVLLLTLVLILKIITT